MVPMNSLRHRLRSERGAELIEFALVFPVLLLVVLGIVDFGFLFQRMEVVTNAAREGARMAVLPGYTKADVENRVCNYILTGGVPMTTCGAAGNTLVTVNMAFPIAMPSGAPMSAKRVEVVYTHNYLFIGPMTSWFGGSLASVPIRGVAIMRDEVQAAGP
jgi:Flp pilus assembly protein TadG